MNILNKNAILHDISRNEEVLQNFIINRKSPLLGRIQNMDPRSIDQSCGPLWTTPYFVKLQAERSLDEREKQYSHFSRQFKLEPMTTIYMYVTAFNICIGYNPYRLPFPKKKKKTSGYDIKLLLSFLTGI